MTQSVPFFESKKNKMIYKNKVLNVFKKIIHKDTTRKCINASFWRAFINSDIIYFALCLTTLQVFSSGQNSVFVHLIRSQSHSQFIHILFHMSNEAHCLHAVQKTKQNKTRNKTLMSSPNCEQVMQITASTNAFKSSLNFSPGELSMLFL